MCKGRKLGKEWNNKWSDTICWAVTYRSPLIWFFVESNRFCYVRLGYSTISAQCIMHLWGNNEDFPNENIFSWVFTITCTLGPDLFVGFYIPLILLKPFNMFVFWMVYVHFIKFPLHIVLGAPTPILTISSNIILLFTDSPWSNIVKSLNITLVGVPYFSVGVCAGLVSVTFSSLNCCKNRSFGFL